MGSLSYFNCELCHIKGIMPVYFDNNPKWIEVNKSTGACREVKYMGYEWLCGKGKDYEESLSWSPAERLFDERVGKGKQFMLVRDEHVSTNRKTIYRK